MERRVKNHREMMYPGKNRCNQVDGNEERQENKTKGKSYKDQRKSDRGHKKRIICI